MATACARILCSTRNYLLCGPGTSERLYLPQIGRVSCSTTSNTSNQNCSKTVPDAPQPSTWDSSKVEQMLKEERQKDMPIKMLNPYEKERVHCILCKYNIHLDYKNPRLLSQFISPYTGKIYGRNITRLCKKQQEVLQIQIKRSVDAGFMAVMLKNVEFLKDPKILDPNNPVRPHNF